MDKGQELLEAVDERGEIGFLDLDQKAQNTATGENLIAVRLGDGSVVFAVPARFSEIQSGRFRFNGSFVALRQNDGAVQTSSVSSQQNDDQQSLEAIDARMNADGEIVVPLIAEEIKIDRKTVETGGVRIHKIVREDVKKIDEPIIREHLEIERVEINKFVETAPAVRYEGDVMIVPVLEEVIVAQKRLLLREEVHLIKRREEISDVQEVTLRREEINLEKIAAEDVASDTPRQ